MPRRPPPRPPKGFKPSPKSNMGKGRPKGVPNKTTSDVRKLAQQYGPDAILGLAILAGIAKPIIRLPKIQPAGNETAQRGAMSDLLDRAYGKATQPLEHSVNESVEGLLDRLGR